MADTLSLVQKDTPTLVRHCIRKGWDILDIVPKDSGFIVPPFGRSAALQSLSRSEEH